jgi:hypothetical protein
VPSWLCPLSVLLPSLPQPADGLFSFRGPVFCAPTRTLLYPPSSHPPSSSPFTLLHPFGPMGCFRFEGLYFVRPPGPFCTHRVPTHQVLAPSLFSTPLGRWAVFVSKACTLCIHPDPFVPFESCVRLECGRFRPQTPSQTGSQADVAASRFSTSRKLRFLVQCACGWFGGCLGICRFHSHHCICFPQILDTSL